MNDWHRPFFADVAVCQIDEFGQGRVVREDPLVLRDLADLAVVAFHGIGCINELPDGLRILEKLAQAVPVVTP